MFKSIALKRSYFWISHPMFRSLATMLEKSFLFLTMMLLMPFLMAWMLILTFARTPRSSARVAALDARWNKLPATLLGLSIYMTDRYLTIR